MSLPGPIAWNLTRKRQSNKNWNNLLLKKKKKKKEAEDAETTHQIAEDALN